MTTPINSTRPNMARMYDYWLGGKHNFEVDRQAAEAVRQLRPNVAEQALDNKRFQTRAVSCSGGSPASGWASNRRWCRAGTLPR